MQIHNTGCLRIDSSHQYDNDLLVREETKNRLHVLEADIITIKKNLDFMSQALNDYHCADDINNLIKFICLHTVKWSNSSISNNSI